MKKLIIIAALAVTAACARPDAILLANFEDDMIGQLPADRPAGAPDDRIILGELRTNPGLTQVIAAPPMALDNSIVAARIDAANTKALSLNPGDPPSGPSNPFRTVGPIFDSELIPSSDRERRHTLSLTGVKSINTASFTLRGGPRGRIATVRVFEDSILISSDESPSIDIDMPDGTNGRFSLRFVVEPATHKVEVTWRMPDQTITRRLSYPDTLVLNRLVLSPLVQNSVSDPQPASADLVIDNVQATPPLRIRLLGVGS